MLLAENFEFFNKVQPRGQVLFCHSFPLSPLDASALLRVALSASSVHCSLSLRFIHTHLPFDLLTQKNLGEI